MTQLKLPLMGIEQGTDLNFNIYELFLYAAPVGGYPSRRAYSRMVDYALAKDQNQAEETFQHKYPEWWKTMGVRKVEISDVKAQLQQLETQLETCKFIVATYSIVK